MSERISVKIKMNHENSATILVVLKSEIHQSPRIWE